MPGKYSKPPKAPKEPSLADILAFNRLSGNLYSQSVAPVVTTPGGAQFGLGAKVNPEGVALRSAFANIPAFGGELGLEYVNGNPNIGRLPRGVSPERMRGDRQKYYGLNFTQKF